MIYIVRKFRQGVKEIPFLKLFTELLKGRKTIFPFDVVWFLIAFVYRCLPQAVLKPIYTSQFAYVEREQEKFIAFVLEYWFEEGKFHQFPGHKLHLKSEGKVNRFIFTSINLHKLIACSCQFVDVEGCEVELKVMWPDSCQLSRLITVN